MTISVTYLRIEIGARVLLDDATFSVAPGEKVAHVGPNGAGKTTLLRTLAGDVAPAEGEIKMPPHVGWLPQDTTPQPGVEKELVFDHLPSASPLAHLRDQL